jgi:hypothetical protein
MAVMNWTLRLMCAPWLVGLSSSLLVRPADIFKRSDRTQNQRWFSLLPPPTKCMLSAWCQIFCVNVTVNEHRVGVKGGQRGMELSGTKLPESSSSHRGEQGGRECEPWNWNAFRGGNHSIWHHPTLQHQELRNGSNWRNLLVIWKLNRIDDIAWMKD